VDRAALLARLYDWNPWWKGIPPAAPEFRRDAFEEIRRHLGQPKTVVLYGLRQTGKTTLLLQLIQATDPPGRRRACYLPLDQVEPDLSRWTISLEELLRVWSEEVAGSPLGQGPVKNVFLDEAHFLKGWAREVKGILDRKWPVRFVVTGSAATSLQREAARLLAGRAFLVELGPLTLREQLRGTAREAPATSLIETGTEWARVLSERLEQGRWDEKALESVVKRFSPLREEASAATARHLERGGYPEIALSDMPLPAAQRMMKTFLTLLVQKDFVEFFRVRDTRTLERLIEILAQGTARILVERKLASDVGASINTVRNHLGFLKNAGLVSSLRARVENAARAARLPEKFHFADPGLRAALVGTLPEDRGHLLDSLLHRHVRGWAERALPGARFFYWREKDRETDLVLEYGRRAVGIEVHAGGSERFGLRAFLERHSKAEGWIVSEGVTGKIEKGIVEIPLGLMLLLA
jgi:predicted AAA+ superfamily ATPase